MTQLDSKLICSCLPLIFPNVTFSVSSQWQLSTSKCSNKKNKYKQINIEEIVLFFFLTHYVTSLSDNYGVSIFKMSTPTSQLPPSIFISTIKAQVNIIFHLDYYSSPLTDHSVSKIS